MGGGGGSDAIITRGNNTNKLNRLVTQGQNPVIKRLVTQDQNPVVKPGC